MIERVLLLFYSLVLATAQDAIVRTSYGTVRGQVKELNGKQFTQFLGVPFAAPPVGDLRFRPPQRHEGWGDTIRDAVEWGPACTQERSFGEWRDPAFPDRLMIYPDDEDCLLLNIWVSGDVSMTTPGSLPVVVFIHGGGFQAGSSKIALGDVFVTDADPVVLVAIQYRLGIFGFLTTGDEVVPGNNGLKDQTFALRWIQENIAAFGGNPDQVTISGQSSGGESVLAHMISRMSTGLFHKAIAQSPSASWIYPTIDRLSGYFQEYAKAFDCQGDSAGAIECLRTKSWQELNSNSFLRFVLVQRVIDGEFLTDEPRHLWAKGEFNDAQLMVGCTSDDGKIVPDYFTAMGFDFARDRSRDLEIFGDSVDFLLALQLSDDKMDTFNATRYGRALANRDDLFTVIKARYYDTETDPLMKARGMLDSFRDAYFLAFGLWTANQVAKSHGDVYVYIFDHATSLLGLDNPGGVTLGAPHTSELPYQFGYGFSDPDTIRMTADELALTRSMIQAWTSYTAGDASYLDINGDKIEWKKYTLEENNVLTFHTNMTSDSLRDDDQWQVAMEFWVAIGALADWEDVDGPTDEPPYPPISASRVNQGACALVTVTTLVLAMYTYEG